MVLNYGPKLFDLLPIKSEVSVPFPFMGMILLLVHQHSRNDTRELTRLGLDRVREVTSAYFAGTLAFKSLSAIM